MYNPSNSFNFTIPGSTVSVSPTMILGSLDGVIHAYHPEWSSPFPSQIAHQVSVYDRTVITGVIYRRSDGWRVYFADLHSAASGFRRAVGKWR